MATGFEPMAPRSLHSAALVWTTRWATTPVGSGPTSETPASQNKLNLWNLTETGSGGLDQSIDAGL